MKIVLGKLGNVMVLTMPGKIFTLVFWTIILVLEVAGTAQIEKDFKLEWFFPEESYVRVSMMVNDKFFSQDFFASGIASGHVREGICESSQGGSHEHRGCKGLG